MNKRIFLIHGWDGSPHKGWFPWLKKELKELNFEVHAPAMPDSAQPKFESWLSTLEDEIGKPTKQDYFVGHSLGCITILRYLETLEPEHRIGGVFLVAGFNSNLGYEEINDFFKTTLDWKKIKSHTTKFFAIHSDNDPFVSTHCAGIFKKKLNAKITMEHKKDHFDNHIKQLPSLLESIKQISS